jgi:hypothetical protein
MMFASFLRFSGLSLIVTGVLFVSFAILYSISSLQPLAHYLNLIGMLFLLLGTVGTYLRQMHAFGILGFTTFLIYFLGAGMWTGFGWASAFVLPALEEHTPHLVSDSLPDQINIGLMISLISFFVGMLLYHLVTAVKAVLPRWPALVLVVVPIIDFIPFGNYLAQPIAGVAFIWIGYTLMNGKYEDSNLAS